MFPDGLNALILRRTASAALFVVTLCVSTVSFAGVRLVDEQNGRLTFEVRFESAEGLGRLSTPGLPSLSYRRLFVAVPHGASVRLEVADGRLTEERGGLPALVELEREASGVPIARPAAGFFPTQPAIVSGSFSFRKTRVVAVDCFRSQVDYEAGHRRVWSGYRLTVHYPPASRHVEAGRSDPLLAGLIENRAYVPAAPGRSIARSGVPVPDPHFSLSGNWIKMRVTAPGIYRITGNDIAATGVALGSIVDPASFRLFTGGGTQLDRDLTQPAGTWIPGNWMTECDIVVDYGGDGTFDPGDRILFYGLGVADYEDLYRPGAPRESRLDHIYDRGNVYYLTWDDSPGFGGIRARMAPQNVTPGAGPDVATYEERLYFEEDRVRELDLGGDGWVWQNISPPGTSPVTLPFLPEFSVTDLDTSQSQTFRTVALAAYSTTPGAKNSDHHAVYIMNDSTIGEMVWSTSNNDRFADAPEVVIVGTGLVSEGLNLFQLHVPRRDLLPPFAPNQDFMLFAWYEVRYHRFLSAIGGVSLPFSSPDTLGTVSYNLTDFAPSGQLFLFDVSDQFHPRMLTGFVETAAGGARSVRFTSTNSGTRQYLWAVTDAGFKRPDVVQRHFPRDLRGVATSPHMLIITHPLFQSAANVLAQHRRGNLPFFPSPNVEVVTVQEVFDNFSGGLVDPVAFRNYCKFLYDNFTDPGGNPLLTFLLLLGDGNIDFKNFTSTLPNFVTTNINMNQLTLEAYITDDWFALMDATDVPGARFIDFAVGRLPAASTQEADALVTKVIGYETQAEFGDWRDTIILIADDENSFRNTRQPDFVLQSEIIAYVKLAKHLNPLKIYLTEFPAISGIKPASRLFLLDAWNKGALVINYTGHGSSKQMADEQVFLDTDVPALVNGLRLPLLVAVSCTIGKFADGTTKSLSEKLLLSQTGGAVATITASELTFINPNATFDFNLFELMFPPDPGLAEPLGVALLQAKARTLGASGSRLVEENNEKYNLLGDPAQRLVAPRRRIVFDRVDIDTLVTGKREIVHGSVLDNGQVDTGFSGTAKLVIREPDDRSGYQRSDGFFIPYNYPGGTIYEGTADVTAGEFEFSIKIPRSAQTGNLGFILGYADNGTVDAAARFDSIEYVRPAPGDTTALVPTDGPPRVVLGFQGGSFSKVKPGAVLRARVRDADGVNTLSTTPEGKLALVFDGSNLPIDVTEFFEFDHGGLDTSGTLLFPLPGLDVGDHQAVFKVSDTFGQTRLDTLRFSLTDLLDFSAEVVLNYPNPFKTSTQFLINLTGRARIRLEIFTVSGRRVRTLDATRDAGEAWIDWDGRDFAGDAIANGMYLYVARVDFEGVDRPQQVLRGKLVKVE